MMSKTIRKRKKDDERAKWHDENTAADMGFAENFSRSTAHALGALPPIDLLSCCSGTALAKGCSRCYSCYRSYTTGRFTDVCSLWPTFTAVVGPCEQTRSQSQSP